ncbi:uncharacterized protein ASPGLDRAFT_39254 [Aspergillus glaucus CBS 516.65]|uniref:Uncharacterized protein n=1 Tax=Aspergillus glaucus CBS 516.65 TaxID=1160497 RepID=A0A1L9V8K2_ASPGL|nr:hypothetical protein ASPGLDRAFT_39254 [Aspergillus glaucus CBS 516.65]OJJ80258.1 hypothetical protein ASPGLDRAFT_39254 [Aspergillus glaucus CBS 516.65]
MAYFQQLDMLYIGARGIFVSRAVVAEVVRVLLDKQMRHLLCRAHQARHYSTELAKVRVMTMAKKVNLHMRKKAIRGTRVPAPSGHVEVQVPVVHPRTPVTCGPGRR